MATHAERMGYGINRTEAPKAAGAPLTREVASKKFYGTPRRDGGGSCDVAASSYYTRRNPTLRDDPERLEGSRAEELKLRALVAERGVTPQRLHDALSVLLEHEELEQRAASKPGISRAAPTEEAYAQAYKTAFEKLRLEEGSEHAAAKVWDRMRQGLEVLNKEIPTLTARGNAPKVAGDIRTIRFLADLVPETTTSATKE